MAQGGDAAAAPTSSSPRLRPLHLLIHPNRNWTLAPPLMMEPTTPTRTKSSPAQRPSPPLSLPLARSLPEASQAHQAPMATPWVLLYRAVSTELAAGAAAGAPDFTLPVAPLPGVAILAAGRSAHPDPNRLDGCPWIIAAAPDCLLAHFAVAPSIGLFFSDNPRDTHLVMARHFRRTADGQITASAERVPDRPVRPGLVPQLSSIFSVGLVPNADGSFTIAELQVHRGSDRATLISFHSGYHEWYDENVESPLPAEDRDRKWAPHGAVVLESTVWWFDLSWGIISCDMEGDYDALLFHRLPPNRALPAATPRMLDHRCITMSQGDLRYVEITREAGAVAVHMWTMVFGQGGWEWEKTYSVSFEEIWNDDSYRATELPRRVPVLAAVCPSEPNLVYFTLKQRIFGVNMHGRRVVHEGPYNLVVNKGTLAPEAAAGRFLLPWHLPPDDTPGAADILIYIST
ncbi:hypothetical protein SETIT_4G135300v2 [Setaria italica]|uniref:DUF1618 domain-containing protein n=2 Tax=Setaria italica TaxID=4555 RepID=A0A368QU88_SETIT|nr:hypothetical protein SETIT_4G135300v2 [Setaria italica]